MAATPSCKLGAISKPPSEPTCSDRKKKRVQLPEDLEHMEEAPPRSAEQVACTPKRRRRRQELENHALEELHEAAQRAAEIRAAELHRQVQEETRRWEKQQAAEAWLRREEDVRKELETRAKSREKIQSFLASMGYEGDVNSQRRKLCKHYYPLHDAVARGDLELIHLLLAAGADPQVRSSSGKTPLDRARKWNRHGSLDHICEVLAAAEFL